MAVGVLPSQQVEHCALELLGSKKVMKRNVIPPQAAYSCFIGIILVINKGYESHYKITSNLLPGDSGNTHFRGTVNSAALNTGFFRTRGDMSWITIF
jgi:hypothetical protein